MQKFSQILIDRMIRHFREKHGVELTPEEAQQYLDSFADLYLCMAGKGHRRPPLARDPDAGEGGAPPA